MATHSTILAWRIPRTKEQWAMVQCHRVGQDWRDLACSTWGLSYFLWDLQLEVLGEKGASLPSSCEIIPRRHSLSPPTRAFLVAQLVKNLPAMQETWVQSLGREDPPEKRMATRSSVLIWEIPWTEEPGGLQSMGCKKVVWLTRSLSPSLPGWWPSQPFNRLQAKDSGKMPECPWHITYFSNHALETFLI